MTIPEIIALRLHNQQISSKEFSNAGDLVTWLGAVQAQDYAAAKWALGLRLSNSTDKEVEHAFNEGTILRTHLMRPTWHFVAPQDIRWLLKLTAPRVIAIINNSGRKLGLDESVFRRANKLIVKALQGGRYLTRIEIEATLNKAGIVTSDLHMIHLMMRAELDGLICSGPRKGKQFTYELLDERAPRSKTLEKEEALAELARRYFLSHGPATVQDFAWWSGLTTKDAGSGCEMVKSKLIHETIDRQAYWFSNSIKSVKEKQAGAYLLPNFDEYTVAYRDRSLLVDAAKVKVMPAPAVLLSNTIIADGKVAGTWKRILKKDRVEVEINLLHALSKSKKKDIAIAVKRYGKFLGLPVTITNAGF